MAVPKTKTESLHKRLMATVERGTSITEFEILIFQREIDALKKVDHFNGLMLEGILYAIANNESDCEKAHRKSLNFAPGDPDAHCNYAVSLKKFLRYSDAAEHFYISFKASPKLLSVSYLLNMIILTGKLNLLPEILEDCKKERPIESILELPFMEAAIEYAEIAGKLKLPTKDLVAVSKKIEEIIKKRNLPIKSFAHREGNFEGKPLLHAVYGVDADGETLYRMNEDLHDFIAEDLSIESWDRLSISFCRFQEDGCKKEFESVSQYY